jgi:hypothetical protein
MSLGKPQVPDLFFTVKLKATIFKPDAGGCGDPSSGGTKYITLQDKYGINVYHNPVAYVGQPPFPPSPPPASTPPPPSPPAPPPRPPPRPPPPPSPTPPSPPEGQRTFITLNITGEHA